jgi:hypothetical protein
LIADVIHRAGARDPISRNRHSASLIQPLSNNARVAQ